MLALSEKVTGQLEDRSRAAVVFNAMGISGLDLGLLFEKLSECYNFRSASGFVSECYNFRSASGYAMRGIACKGRFTGKSWYCISRFFFCPAVEPRVGVPRAPPCQLRVNQGWVVQPNIVQHP